MPRKQCYWTRKLELDLVDFVRRREYIWKPLGNTNHHIQQKYKAYAEFASKLGRGFTARSVRDRWVNIRSTYNHILRRIEKSQETASSQSDIYVPCWPLWKPMQFLRAAGRKEENYEAHSSLPSSYETIEASVKQEVAPDIQYANSNIEAVGKESSINNDIEHLPIRQRGERTNRPRKRLRFVSKSPKTKKCKRLINDLVKAMNPLFNSQNNLPIPEKTQDYWFFGKHVTQQLNSMRHEDAECASREILKVLEEFTEEDVLSNTKFYTAQSPITR